jgi:DNA-3-methyladenine glycosylase II
MLGLEVDLGDFYRQAESEPVLCSLACRFRGLKPPRFPTMFECLANAIACQQLTLTFGITLVNRLAERYGRVAGEDGLAQHAFPDAADLAVANYDDLRRLSFSGAKANALLALARGVSGAELDLEGLTSVPAEDAVAALGKLRGIGRWSAEYALLRGLGTLSVFPADDVGARRNLRRFLPVDSVRDYEAARSAVSRWAPYAGLAYFHLLLDYLDRDGALDAIPVGAGPTC